MDSDIPFNRVIIWVELLDHSNKYDFNGLGYAPGRNPLEARERGVEIFYEIIYGNHF
jgi:hypothetical protein